MKIPLNLPLQKGDFSITLKKDGRGIFGETVGNSIRFPILSPFSGIIHWAQTPPAPSLTMKIFFYSEKKKGHGMPCPHVKKGMLKTTSDGQPVLPTTD
jgi:hypothetical protein